MRVKKSRFGRHEKGYQEMTLYLGTEDNAVYELR